MGYTDTDLLDALAAVTDESGHPPSAAEMNAHNGSPSVPTYQSRFGSWNEALAAAGLETAGYSDADRCALLTTLAEELDRRPTIDDLVAHDALPPLSSFVDHFGSWNEALAAVGLGSSEVSAPDPAALRAALAWLTRELGRVPVRARYGWTGRFSAGAYQTHFGSWEAALALTNQINASFIRGVTGTDLSLSYACRARETAPGCETSTDHASTKRLGLRQNT